MKFKLLNILIAVLLICTAIYTFSVFLPNTKEEVVNTEIYAVANTPIQEEKYINPLGNLLSFVEGNTSLISFKLLNRELPTRWKGKEIYFKYTYLGEYTESTVEELDTLLDGDYKWQRQLDENKNIVLGGPIFIKDDIYQLHTHNGLSLANKHYLFGDLLHLLFTKGELEGTQIQIGDVVLEAIWSKDTRILQDSSTPPDAQLVISTCLERNGDRRLISGWIVTPSVESQ
ncbi:MAG: hypothetical protein RBT33_01715 [Candidatus Dojkabacteria bacterium]|jgi:hypothetical protein|nr:hypothetical protein [Candidatus Dojkabacteria bacterium]